MLSRFVLEFWVMHSPAFRAYRVRPRGQLESLARSRGFLDLCLRRGRISASVTSETDHRRRAEPLDEPGGSLQGQSHLRAPNTRSNFSGYFLQALEQRCLGPKLALPCRKGVNGPWATPLRLGGSVQHSWSPIDAEDRSMMNTVGLTTLIFRGCSRSQGKEQIPGVEFAVAAARTAGDAGQDAFG